MCPSEYSLRKDDRGVKPGVLCSWCLCGVRLPQGGDHRQSSGARWATAFVTCDRSTDGLFLCLDSVSCR